MYNKLDKYKKNILQLEKRKEKVKQEKKTPNY